MSFVREHFLNELRALVNKAHFCEVLVEVEVPMTYRVVVELLRLVLMLLKIGESLPEFFDQILDFGHTLSPPCLLSLSKLRLNFLSRVFIHLNQVNACYEALDVAVQRRAIVLQQLEHPRESCQVLFVVTLELSF